MYFELIKLLFIVNVILTNFTNKYTIINLPVLSYVLKSKINYNYDFFDNKYYLLINLLNKNNLINFIN